MHVHLQGHTLTVHAGGGAERWGEPKGRGRGLTPEPGRRTPRDGFTDRWVGGPGEEPSPGGRPPRMEKWCPEGGARTSQRSFHFLHASIFSDVQMHAYLESDLHDMRRRHLSMVVSNFDCMHVGEQHDPTVDRWGHRPAGVSHFSTSHPELLQPLLAGLASAHDSAVQAGLSSAPGMCMCQSQHESSRLCRGALPACAGESFRVCRARCRLQ